MLPLELTDQEVFERMAITLESEQEIPMLEKWVRVEASSGKERWPNYQLRDR